MIGALRIQTTQKNFDEVEADLVTGRTVAVMLGGDSFELRATYLPMPPSKERLIPAPYSAAAGESIPVRQGSGFEFARVAETLERQGQPCVLYRSGEKNQLFIKLKEA